MSLIRINGNQFEMNTWREREGQTARRPYIMRTSFCLLGHYQAGNAKKAREWLDRIKEQGADGPRLFGEVEDWFIDNEGNAFFGNPRYTTNVIAFGNTNPNGGASSKIKLVPGYRQSVELLAQDLIDRGMVAEFCCIATVKSWKNPGWTSHGLNKFAQLFAEMFPDPKDTPFLHETINEADAHIGWPIDGEWRKELMRMGPRWRRDSQEPGHYNYPGSTIGVSAGGQYDPGFDDLGYTHRNIHPPRGADWDKGPDGVDIGNFAKEVLRKKVGNRPLAFNETVHYMSPSQWSEWIPKVPKWHGLSTQSADRCMAYYRKLLTAGVSVCVHDMNGMSTNPSLPITELERKLAAVYGMGDTNDPSPNPQEPDIPRPILGIIKRGYNELLFREPDPVGQRAYAEAIQRGMSEARFREQLLRAVLKHGVGKT